MGNNFLSRISTFLIFSMCVTFVRLQQIPTGKPCLASFHCWRTEPVGKFGLPVGLDASLRAKRLDISSSLSSKGGMCRCSDGTCKLFDVSSATFFDCEEF
ncbi:unnamed protein product [Caenorhabditis auriculariae]|uniref:Uncharacterized protein n=1 Tax=Caenorhabditis auriculariae TaxID=2777116 RepID=A0A8S1HL70_9PELO|nr:unnamed protein product [Caenorhabditis auriculariae]